MFNQKTYETVFKDKLPRLVKLARKMGLSLLKGELQPANLKTKEQFNTLKEKIFWAWCRTFNQSNVWQHSAS